jgi:hypothetical protein
MRSSLQALLLLALTACAADWCPADHRDPPASGSRQRPAVAPEAREIRMAFQTRAELPRRKLLARLQKLGKEGDYPELVAAVSAGFSSRLSQKTSDTVDRQLVSLLAGYESEEATECLLACLQASDWRIVLTALRGLLDSGRADHWEAVRGVAQRTDYSDVYALRRAVVAYAESNASPSAVEFLINTMENSKGQLKYESAVSLTKLTGQSFGGITEKWRNWWKTAREEFVAVPPKERKTISLAQPDFAWEDPLPEFFGLPVYALRIVFVLDRSASMGSSINGETRIDRARKELEQAMEQLPEGTAFNVLAYHDFVSCFAPRLVPATTESKHQAILFAHSLLPELHTACYDALEAGLLADPNLEAMYFLSDGEPTSGKIVEPMRIVAAITQLNQFQQTSIYTLGIDARGIHEEFLKQLAANNFGEFFLIR